MGTWAADTLSNDGAQDFLISVLQSKDGWDVIAQTFKKVMDANHDVWDEEGAIAGAELVAAAIGKASAALGQEDLDFATTLPVELIEPLSSAAKAVLEKIEIESELRALWMEANPTLDILDLTRESDLHIWLKSMADLKMRLEFVQPQN